MGNLHLVGPRPDYDLLPLLLGSLSTLLGGLVGAVAALLVVRDKSGAEFLSEPAFP